MAVPVDPLATANGGGSVDPLGGGSTEPAVAPFTSPFPNFNQVNDGSLTAIQAEVLGAIDECAAALGTADQLIMESIKSCNEQCRLDAAGCGACILGAIERDTTFGAETIAKCWTRIADHVNATVQEMYAASFAAGISPPTADQLEAALSGLPIPEATVQSLDIGIAGEPQVVALNPVGLADQAVPALPPIPPGTVRPILDLTGTFLTCPNPSAPYPSPLSPTGYLADNYIPVRDDTGRLLYCRIETNVTQPPTNGGGGGVPPVSGGAGGGTGTNGSTTSNGQSTLPGTGGTPPSGSPVSDTPPSCPDGYDSVVDDISGGRGLLLEGQGHVVIRTGTYTSDGKQWLCVSQIAGPPSPVTPPDKPPQTVGLSVCDPTQLGRAVSEFTSQSFTGKDIAQSIREIFGTPENQTPCGILDFLKTPATCFGEALSSFVGSIYSAANWVFTPGIGQASGDSGCTDGLQVYNYVVHGVTNFLSRITGFVPQQTLVSQLYGLNYRCQYLLPTGTQATAAVSRGYLTDEQAEFIWKCEGQCVPWQKLLVEASKTRIGIQDAYRLFKLGLIDSSEFFEAWKRQGVDTDKDIDKWYETVKQYPGMGDLVRMMVRDIGDEAVVDKLGLDVDFENKWAGELQTWGVAQGVEDNVARAYWRAHWQAPSPQQIFTFLQRLRPDDRSPDDQFASIVVTPDDAKDFLRIADYVPGLLDAYIATSYRPYTRVDIRRMYRVGVFNTEEEIRRAYRDLGSDAEHAANLAKFTVRSERASRAKEQGAVPAAEIAKAYRNDYISRSDANNQLDAAGLDAEQINATLQAEDFRRNIVTAKRVFDSLKKRYFFGEFDATQLANELRLQGMSSEAVQRTVDLWADERAARAKQPTVSMLCTWFDRGMITIDEYFRRVRNLNYSEVDANRIILTCQGDIAKRKADEIVKEQARIEKLRVQQLKDEARAAAAARRANREQRKTERIRVNGKITNRVTDTHVLQVDPGLQIVTVDQQSTTG